MHRIVGLRWRPGDYESRQVAEASARRLLAGAGWKEVCSTRGFRLFITEGARDLDPIVLPNGAGLILGALFETEAGLHRRKGVPEPQEVSRWCESNASALASACWGNYLAIVVDAARDRILVARDPTGGRPCYVANLEHHVRIIFTDLSDFATMCALPDIDETFIGWFLTQPRLVSDRTGLHGVREVLAGECLAIEVDGAQAHLMWRPPQRARDLMIAPVADIARELRACVRSAVAAYASLERPVLHRLSGGLDSSIALSALAATEAHGRLRCVNEFTADLGEGDERSAARATASRYGVDLIEMPYRPSDLDYQRLMDVPLSAKPAITQLSFADRQLISHIDPAWATLVTSGQGGDQVFFRSNALCTVADAVRDGLSVRAVLVSALNAARVSRRSIWPALRMGVEFGLLRRPDTYVREILHGIVGRQDAARVDEVVAEAMADPWVREGLKLGPGAGMRALHLADLQYYHAPSVITHHAIPAPVLTAQPIIEFCWRVPTYRTTEGGRDRAIARMAFAEDLPPSAAARQRKGDTTRFFAQVAQLNGEFIRDLLIDGELTKMGLFDPKRLNEKPASAVLDFSQELVAEIWLRRIKAARRAFVEARASVRSDRDRADRASPDP